MDLKDIQNWSRRLLEAEAKKRGVRSPELYTRIELVRIILRRDYASPRSLREAAKLVGGILGTAKAALGGRRRGGVERPARTQPMAAARSKPPAPAAVQPAPVVQTAPVAQGAIGEQPAPAAVQTAPVVQPMAAAVQIAPVVQLAPDPQPTPPGAQTAPVVQRGPLEQPLAPSQPAPDLQPTPAEVQTAPVVQLAPDLQPTPPGAQTASVVQRGPLETASDPAGSADPDPTFAEGAGQVTPIGRAEDEDTLVDASTEMFAREPESAPANTHAVTTANGSVHAPLVSDASEPTSDHVAGAPGRDALAPAEPPAQPDLPLSHARVGAEANAELEEQLALPAAPYVLYGPHPAHGLRVRWNVTPVGLERARALLGEPGELALRIVAVAADSTHIVSTEVTDHGPVDATGEWIAPLSPSSARYVSAIGLRNAARFVSIVHAAG